MREEPSAAELLDAVSDFLRDQLMPALSGPLAFHTRIAANVLDIVRRELATGEQAQARETARLSALLGEDGDAATLNARLCEAIAARRFAHDDPALTAHLWATTLDTLAIDQPKYETFRRALTFAGQDQSPGE